MRSASAKSPRRPIKSGGCFRRVDSLESRSTSSTGETYDWELRLQYARATPCVPLSRYIDCGNSTGIGPNADSYQVNLEFVVEVQPVDAGSSVRTTLQAMAKPVTFAQDYSACSSKTALESRFADILFGANQALSYSAEPSSDLPAPSAASRPAPSPLAASPLRERIGLSSRPGH
jgi:hypothetical protein